MFVGDYAFIPPAVARSNNIDADGNLGALKSWGRTRVKRLAPLSRVGSRISSSGALPFKRVPSLRAAGKYRTTLRQHLRGIADYDVPDDGYADPNRDGYPQYGTTMEGLGFWQALMAPFAQLIGSRQATKAAHSAKDAALINASAADRSNAAQREIELIHLQSAQLETASGNARTKMLVIGGVAAVVIGASIFARKRSR